MNKRDREVVYLSQLESVQVLWPGDIRALAEFSLRCHDTKDKIFNAGQHGSARRSRSTLHGLASYYERITGIPESQIEEQLGKQGL